MARRKKEQLQGEPKKKRTRLDDIDVQMLSLLAADPTIKISDIAIQLGISEPTVYKHRRKIKTNRDIWFEQTVGALKALCPLMVKVVAESLREKPNPWIAIKIMQGLGVLNEKIIHEHTGSEGMVRMLNAFLRLPESEQEELIARAEADLTDTSGADPAE